MKLVNIKESTKFRTYEGEHLPPVLKHKRRTALKLTFDISYLNSKMLKNYNIWKKKIHEIIRIGV